MSATRCHCAAGTAFSFASHIVAAVTVLSSVELFADARSLPATLPGAAQALLDQLDLTRPELSEVAALAARGNITQALGRWRDMVVLRLRRHDSGHFGWHGYALHPRPTGAADMMAGIISRKEYLNNPNGVDFIDIFGISGPPGDGKPIHWFVDIHGPIDWGSPKFAAMDDGWKLLKTNYANFEFLKSFTGRYWQTGRPVYLQQAFDIMSDFARNHRRQFWAAYARKPFGDKEVREFYRCDWRLNTNGLGTGWRAKNFMKNLAGLCKCISSDKPSAWDDVLKPVRGMPSRHEFDRIPAAQLADIAVSLVRDHTGKLLWFCIDPGAVPNQRAEGLKALAFISAIFSGFKVAPRLTDYVTRGYEDYLDSNFLPDGGSLEQSFNYNQQDKDGLEELIRFFGDDPPPYAQFAQEKVAARRAVDDGLQTPLGGLPQVGNSHTVLGKDVWSGDDVARRYLAAELPGKQPIRPQSYASKAFPYSGYYAMRTGWGMKDLYLFFMAGRPQRGHSMRDNNAIQVTAYGRQLVVCGGSPTYGQFRNDDARGADFYLSEASSLKNNTVIVDGMSQAKNAPKAARAYRTPVHSLWHTSSRFDLVDGVYELGYCRHENGRDVDIDMSVQHYRCVTFVKSARLWVIEDRLERSDSRTHTYTQVWNFPPHCVDADWRKTIAGFEQDQFAFDTPGKRFRTADPNGPNIEFRHFGPRRVEYRKYYGDRYLWLGWYAAGIGDARPAPDVHVSWQSEDSDVLVTLMAPMDKGQSSPVTLAEPLAAGQERGFAASLANGARLDYLCAAKPTRFELGPVQVSARALLLCTSPDGARAGIVTGCKSMRIDGKLLTIDGADFEFEVDAEGGVTRRHFAVCEVPVIERPLPFTSMDDSPPVVIRGAHDGLTIRYTTDGSAPTSTSPVYTGPFKLRQPCIVKARLFRGTLPRPLVAAQDFYPRQWLPQPPAIADASSLEQGLQFELYHFTGGYIRLYDLMLRKPVASGQCDSLAVERWNDQRAFGVKWRGYLRIPRDGIYHFHSHAPSGARVFLDIADDGLELPPVVHPSYVTQRGAGSTALRAGFHPLEVHYVRFPTNPNQFALEVQGPGIARQPLPASWLWRQQSPPAPTPANSPAG